MRREIDDLKTMFQGMFKDMMERIDGLSRGDSVGRQQGETCGE